MGGLGWHNPLPLELGGGDSLVERIYRAMRSMVGKGGSAPDDANTIDGLWRQVRATAIASVASGGERAVLQAFPDRATDLLPYYDRLFLLTSEPGTSDQDRRQAAARLYALQIASDLPSVQAELQRIDPRFALVPTDPDESCTTVFGRAFEDLDAADPFVADLEGGAYAGVRHSTAFPNYSSDFICYVILDLGDGVAPGPPERRAMELGRRLLHDLLPAANSFHITTHQGFTLDVSLLDITGLE